MNDETIWIEGMRLVLRDVAPNDLDVLAYWLRPEQRWQELDGPMYDQPTPTEIARILGERRALAEGAYRPRPRTNLSIAAIDTDAMLGEVTWSGAADGTGLNIVIYNPDLWGYGLGYEALGLWCAYLFRERPDLPQLDLGTWSGNAGMIRLAQKLGFTEQRRDHRAAIVSGRHFDRLRYVLERDVWYRQFPEGFASTLGGEQ